MRGIRTLVRRRKAKIRRRHIALNSAKMKVSLDLPKGASPRTSYQLSFPSILDFDENFDETLNFFSQLVKLILKIKPKSIRIDHSALQKISPAAALVLIAQIVRGSNLLPRCKWRGNEATNQEVRDLLGEVGYWGYFKGKTWVKTKTQTRQYLRHKTGNHTVGVVVKELVQHFLPEIRVAEENKKTLYPAIIECMDNVMKHAYPISEKGTYHFNRWWLLGFRDLQTHEVFLCFYDQGLGIPKTIRVRLKDQFGPLSPPDSALIVKAVVEGHYSSTKDPTRGRGLPTLKRFIDAAKSGELTIVSHRSRCVFSKGPTEEENFDTKFDGTLIIWRLQN
jgi:anti-sigma regulatory factor (Ser/Thr protein kinase)